MIPTCDDLRSDTLWHRSLDLFNPPGLTNFLGCVQADLDVTGIRSLNFPPFACSDTVTASLFLDGIYFPSTGERVGYTWYPDRIERVATHDGVRVHTVLALAVGRMAAVQRIEITNLGEQDREVEVSLALRGGVTNSRTGWVFLPPTESDNQVTFDGERRAFHFSARASSAHLLQGILVQGGTVDAADGSPATMTARLTLKAGAAGHFDFVAALAESVADAGATYDALIQRVDDELQNVRAFWNQELNAVFTPGNDRYAGSLPVLETSDRELLRAYHMGVLGVIYFKRDSPYSVHGRAYDTLMPRYWQTVTFLWDYHLSGLVHALLDPHVMRANLERWMSADVSRNFGFEWLGGSGVGPWYAVNDYALVSLAREYLRWSGELQWLDRDLRGESGSASVRERVVSHATAWQQLRTGSGLADFGGLDNLLECVSSYTHEIASLNAAAVFTTRFAAELLGGETSRARELTETAAQLVQDLMPLYVDGGGHWRARYPDGRVVPVRHCYDLLTVLGTIAEDLSETQKVEMTRFFVDELQTPAWMRALSTRDPDASFSVRPDHQWTGAYPAWPPLTVSGLYRIGRADLAAPWLRALGRSANQGPFGQAHFAEAVVDPDEGGARKASPEFPFICDWAVSSGGSWVAAVIEGTFGVRPTLRDGIGASPQFAGFDPDARLRNLGYQGRLYDVDATGIKVS